MCIIHRHLICNSMETKPESSWRREDSNCALIAVHVFWRKPMIAWVAMKNGFFLNLARSIDYLKNSSMNDSFRSHFGFPRKHLAPKFVCILFISAGHFFGLSISQWNLRVAPSYTCSCVAFIDLLAHVMPLPIRFKLFSAFTG